MTFENETAPLGQINMLERWALVTSILYYEYDVSIVSDYVFDMNFGQLKALHEQHPEIALESRYSEVFRGTNYCTGYDLCSRAMRCLSDFEMKKVLKSVETLKNKET